jgi:hypothetical protein
MCSNAPARLSSLPYADLNVTLEIKTLCLLISDALARLVTMTSF